LLAKLDTLTRRSGRILKAEERLEKLQNKVSQSTQAHKAAGAQLKSDIGARDKAVVEMQRIIKDVRSGQGVLPGTDDDDESVGAAAESTAEAVSLDGDADTWPISELGAKRIKAIAGPEVVESAKDSVDPIGLSDKQLEKLESAEFPTIGALEKAMRENAWWWKAIANDGASAVVQRVISTLNAFRSVNPHQERTPTILENLAKANAEPSPAATEAVA
jgi:hypothetical protein